MVPGHGAVVSNQGAPIAIGDAGESLCVTCSGFQVSLIVQTIMLHSGEAAISHTKAFTREWSLSNSYNWNLIQPESHERIAVTYVSVANKGNKDVVIRLGFGKEGPILNPPKPPTWNIPAPPKQDEYCLNCLMTQKKARTLSYKKDAWICDSVGGCGSVSTDGYLRHVHGTIRALMEAFDTKPNQVISKGNVAERLNQLPFTGERSVRLPDEDE
jgi:hypothetical protein